jgi:hypothetical protein
MTARDRKTLSTFRCGVHSKCRTSLHKANKRNCTSFVVYHFGRGNHRHSRQFTPVYLPLSTSTNDKDLSIHIIGGPDHFTGK